MGKRRRMNTHNARATKGQGRSLSDDSSRNSREMQEARAANLRRLHPRRRDLLGLAQLDTVHFSRMVEAMFSPRPHPIQRKIAARGEA